MGVFGGAIGGKFDAVEVDGEGVAAVEEGFGVISSSSGD